jgi:hypothetical protein
MVERIDDMPAGTVGFRASGEVRVWGLDGLTEAREWVAG